MYFYLFLAAILVVTFLLGQALFRNVKDPKKKLQYSIGFTAIAILAAILVYILRKL